MSGLCAPSAYGLALPSGGRSGAASRAVTHGSPPAHSQPPSIELGNCPIDPDPKAKIQNPLGAEAKELHGHNKIATQSLQRFRSARPCILCCPPTATPPISHPCKSQVWCSGIFHYRGKIRLSGEAKSNWIIELSIIGWIPLTLSTTMLPPQERQPHQGASCNSPGI